MEENGIFNGTIFKTNPFYLYRFAEVSSLNLTITDNYLSLFTTVTFPVLKEENILPQFRPVQVGYMFTQEEKRRCVRHVLPDRVILFQDSYYEMQCERSMPELCRVNFSNMDPRSGATRSCFHGNYVDCMKFPVDCDTQGPHHFEEGLLISTSQEVQRITEDSHVQLMEQRDGAIFIPWSETVSIVIGNKVHHNPHPDVTTLHTNSSFIFDIDVRYSRVDLMFLLNSNINLTTSMHEEEAAIRFVAEHYAELEVLLDAAEEQVRKAGLHLIISISISATMLIVLVVSYCCTRKCSCYTSWRPIRLQV